VADTFCAKRGKSGAHKYFFLERFKIWHCPASCCHNKAAK
jgi:hypothetical protein